MEGKENVEWNVGGSVANIVKGVRLVQLLSLDFPSPSITELVSELVH